MTKKDNIPISKTIIMPYNPIFTLHNKKPKEECKKLKLGDLELMKNSKLDQLIELIKMIFIEALLKKCKCLMKMKNLIYIPTSRNYIPMFKTKIRKPLTGEDHIMPIDMVNSDRAYSYLIFF